MEVDHIFIFSDQRGREADQLVEFGLLEGSNRIHPGQGTTNRKFYFENFFLEIVWVTDEEELRSPLTAPINLWERSQFRNNANSRFGLGLKNTDDTNGLFANSQRYQPVYVPEGSAFEILTHLDNPSLPWTFRIPFGGSKKIVNEPMNHPNGIRRLTKVTFGLPNLDSNRPFTQPVADYSIVHFVTSPSIQLTLEFDHHRLGRSAHFEALNLTITF